MLMPPFLLPFALPFLLIRQSPSNIFILSLLLTLSDLQFDYTFHLDGTIEVRLSASGYLQGGYWTPESNAYGGRIGITSSQSSRFPYRLSRADECIVGNLHDHVINFKYVLSHSHLYDLSSLTLPQGRP